MPSKLLLTGVTGYIGGDVFYALQKAHPELEYTLVVRSESRAKLVQEKYTEDRIKIVYTTESASYLQVLEEEASKTDIVLHTAESADDVPSAKAISAGILKADRTASNPIFWIHLSGTGILQWYDAYAGRAGQPPLPREKYDDIDDIIRLITLPMSAMHRDVDTIVLDHNHLGNHIKTAIVAPCTIYGKGRGPVNTLTQQIPNLARYVFKNGFAPVVGPPGLTEWDNVHIHDVSSLFVAIVGAALDPKKSKDPELFGLKAYYFCENGKPHVWAKVAAAVAQEAVNQGYLKEAVCKTVGPDDVTDSTLGRNSKSVASRARKYLAWDAKNGANLEGEIEGIVKAVAEQLGVKKLQDTL
ncbi:hypothetical protein OQA88_4208 [Cercophora sp. LCS_1]